MPSKPLRPCVHFGCSEMVSGGYCDVHQQQNQRAQDQRRGTATERGYNSRWQKERATFLRLNPLCVVCEREGRIEPATVVDHITPHKGNMDLFWNVNNWQSLCKKHHDIKTVAEDGGFGNACK